MKKVLFYAAAAAMLMTACQSKKEAFVLTASELPAEFNNTYAYLVEERENVDSVLIADGAFTMTIDSLTADKVSYIAIGENVFFPFIKEAGDFKLVATPAEDGTTTYSVAPTKENANSLNTKLSALAKSVAEASAPIIAAYKQKSDLFSANPNMSKDSVALLQKEMDDLSTQLDKETNSIAQKTYEENKDNVIGLTAFQYMAFDKDEDFVAAYERASNIVKADENLTKRYETLKTAMNTQAGAKYVDFTMEDGLGNSAKLSDYLADGRYLLVDFWASWCGPCRRAMPHLADLNKKHAAKLRVLSVGTWDKTIEDNNKAKEELKMTWDTYYDSKNAGATAYGVSGVPTILLISPEGDILVRTHNPEDVDAKIAELKL